MEETKRLNDAIRLRDAYILFTEAIRKWDNISDVEYYDGKDKNWHFYKSISFYMPTEDKRSIYSINVIFDHHKESDDSCINLFRCSFCKKLIETREILKDYKDLIE